MGWCCSSPWSKTRHSNVFPVVHPCGLTFTWWGCYGLCQRHKPTKLAHSFLFSSCVRFCLYSPFNCISFHKFSRQLFAFSLFFFGLNSAVMVLSTIYRFMKVSLSPDIILCGGLGLRHQLTTLPCPRTANRHLILVLTASRDDGEFCIWGTAPGQRSTGHNAPINQTYFCTCKGHTFYRDTKVRWRLISVDIFFLHSHRWDMTTQGLSVRKAGNVFHTKTL